MEWKAPEGLGLEPELETNSLKVLHEGEGGSPGVVEGRATYDLSTDGTIQEEQLHAPTAHAGGKPQSDAGGGRYSVAFKASIVLAIALCVAASVGSMLWGRGRKRSSGAAPSARIEHTRRQTSDLDNLTPREAMMKEREKLEEDLLEALVDLRQRAESYELPLKEIVPGAVPDDNAVMECLNRALDALSTASPTTQQDMASKYLKELLGDSEHHSPAQLLEYVVQRVKAVTPSEEESDPDEAEAQGARTTLLVAVLEAFTARVKGLAHLEIMAAGAADEEAILEKNPGEGVGLAYLLESHGAPEEVVGAVAQQVESAGASVPQLKARQLVNYNRISRQKLVVDSEVAAALFSALKVEDDWAPRADLDVFEELAVYEVQQQTTLKDRERASSRAILNEYRLLREIMEGQDQGKAFLGKAFNFLSGIHRLDKACRTGASQRSDFWEFLKYRWSPKVHDTLYRLIKEQDEISEKVEQSSRSYLIRRVRELSKDFPRSKQVDALLLQAAIALL